MKYIKYWILAIRPKTLPISISPVLMGSAFAYTYCHFSPFYFYITTVTALLIQIGTNLCNDYYDFKKGADTEERIGPIRVTQAGLISPNKIKFSFLFVFFSAAAIGSILVHRGGIAILIIGISSLLCGFLYTGGSFALAYIGFAEFFVILFFGPIAVAGTYFIQTLNWNMQTISAGFLIGLLSCSVLILNNCRDMKQDMKANKKTLAVRFGLKFANKEYIYCIMLSSAISYYLCAYITSIILLILLMITEKRSFDKLLAQTALSIPILTIIFVFENLFSDLLSIF